MTKPSAVQHQDAADGAKDADECIWLLPAADLERYAAKSSVASVLQDILLVSSVFPDAKVSRNIQSSHQIR